MLKKVQLDKVLFLDVETVPQVYQFQYLNETNIQSSNEYRWSFCFDQVLV